MSIALPWMLAVGLVGAAVVGALHLLSVRRPPTLLLPTARFVPDRDVRAVSRTRTPSDLLLLALRVLALLGAAFAVAGVQCAAGRASVGQVVVIDRGVSMDSAALRRIVQGANDHAALAMAALPSRDVRTNGSASAALFPLAWRTTRSLLNAERRLDSVDLHLFVARAPASDDAGWRAWRTTWPGRIVLHVPESTAVADSTIGRPSVLVRRGKRGVPTAASDAVVSGFRAAGVAARDDARAGAQDAVDSAVIVQWPADGIPMGWRAYDASDSAASTRVVLMVQGRALAGDLHAAAEPTAADTAGVMPIAWWSDGRIAALERRAGASCVREVGVRVDESSDALLTPEAAEFFARLAAPCMKEQRLSVPSFTRVLPDGGASATTSELRATLGGARSMSTTWWTPLLLGLALMLIAMEWWLRARDLSATDGSV